MLPLVSSEKALAALIRCGCYTPRPQRGSHLTVCKDTAQGRLTQILVMGRHEVKRFTLKSVLQGLEITEEEFLSSLR